MSSVRELLARGPLRPPRDATPRIEFNVDPKEIRGILQEVDNDESAISAKFEAFVYVGDRL